AAVTALEGIDLTAGKTATVVETGTGFNLEASFYPGTNWEWMQVELKDLTESQINDLFVIYLEN
ncbi:MAG: hypothetical protein ACFFA4_07520, partial [Promethearchaeota archaeon]